MAKKKLGAKKGDRAALEIQQTAEVAWLASQWQEHPVVGLTPQRLHRLLTSAEQGNLQAQADLFCDMEERDGHIFSEMDRRKKAVNGLDWGVNPAKNANEAERKIAEQVTEWIDDIKDFEMFLFDAMDAVGHGYSCQEIVWHQLGRIWLPKSFEYALPRHFMTPYEQPNVLRLNDGSLEGADFWDFGWFVHRHKAKSGYISRSGLHRVLSWSFLFKNYGVRDVMEFLEIYGLPIRIGKYPSGATAEEKMTLARAVVSIGRSAGGIIPQGMAIDFESAAQGDTDNHMALIKWCEQSQSKVIVGGTLLSQADGKTSTNAQSKTHEVQFEKLVKSDALQLARSMNDGLIAYLMRLNFPHITPDRYPEFYFDTCDVEDLQSFSDALPKLVEIGFKIPRTWAHEKLGIPEPTKDDEILQTVVQDMPALAVNSVQPHLVGNVLAANAAQMSVDEQAVQILLHEQARAAQATVEHWTQDLLLKIQAGQSDEEMLAVLQDAYPSDDEPALQQKLTQLIFAAEVFARLGVEAEHG